MYFRDLMPDGPPRATDSGRQRALLRRIGADGWLGLGWPVAYGGQGRGADDSFYRDELTGLPEMGVVARQLWRTSGLTATEMDVGILYDHFTPFVLMQSKEFGFCKPGEAADFVAEERLPLNTQGDSRGGVPVRDERRGGGGTAAACNVREPDI